MKISELIIKIEKQYKKESAYDFDNPGLNVNLGDVKISNVLVCLDVSLSAIKDACDNNCNLIISHHPLIWDPIKNIDNSILANKIKLLIKNNIQAYSMHTNFDVNIKSGMGKIVLDKLFSKTEIRKLSYIEEFVIDKSKYALGNVIYLKKTISASFIKDRLVKSFNIDMNKIQVYDSGSVIKKVVIIPGSGCGEIEKVIKEGCDCLITSDLKHNQIIDLMESDITYVNATHYGLEKVFVDYVADLLTKTYKIKSFKHYESWIKL